MKTDSTEQDIHSVFAYFMSKRVRKLAGSFKHYPELTRLASHDFMILQSLEYAKSKLPFFINLNDFPIFQEDFCF